MFPELLKPRAENQIHGKPVQPAIHRVRYYHIDFNDSSRTGGIDGRLINGTIGMDSGISGRIKMREREKHLTINAGVGQIHLTIE